jgi:hypothetical protein
LAIVVIPESGSFLLVKSDVDPRSLAINKRYRNNSVLPAEVRNAKINLMDDVYEAVMRGTRKEWGPPNPASVILTLGLSRKSDLDGPVKHTLDALQDGLRKAGYAWNDKYIDRLVVRRVPPDFQKIRIELLKL